jgi:hypothetical protein
LSRGSRFPRYDVSPNGERFILSEPVGLASNGAGPLIRVVQNWYEEFRDREQN